jgi:hypothetical protein
VQGLRGTTREDRSVDEILAGVGRESNEGSCAHAASASNMADFNRNGEFRKTKS